MKQILVILPLLFLYNLTGFAQDTIYSYAYNQSPNSYFEDRDSPNYIYLDSTQSNNIWAIGAPSKTVFNAARSAPLALVTDTLNTYPTNNQSSFEFVIVTDDFTSIEFWHKYDTDSLEDGGMIEVSSDGGSNWINIIDDSVSGFWFENFYNNTDTISSLNNKPGFTGSSGGWISSRIATPGGLWFYRFRFTFASDSSNSGKDGWMIDNLDYICLGTSIKEAKLNDLIDLYPSPTIDLLTIDLHERIKFKGFRVYDDSGKLIRQGTNKSVDTSYWSDGIYFITVTTDQGSVSKRIVKMNAR